MNIPTLSLLTLLLLSTGCTNEAPAPTPDPAPTLQNAFADAFLIGAALNDRQFSGADAQGAALVAEQFNTITPENVLKWGLVHPEPDQYDFAAPDQYVAFGEEHGMFIIGHTLVWHHQTPDWVFEDAEGNPLTRDALLARMRDHIHTVVGRYQGRIDGWDVVNEALNDDGSMRETPWYTIIGPDYLEHAFRFAHEADPDAELYYNDYALENTPKRAGAVRLVQSLLDAGVPIAGLGTQNHVMMDWPTLGQFDTTLTTFADLGVQVMITEVDVNVLPHAWEHRGADLSVQVALQDSLDPYRAGLPDSVQQALAQRYADLFGVYYRHRDAVSRVTFWGVDDADSWLNGWPVPGRTSYPLLFDRAGQPKPAYDAVIAVPHP